MIKHRFLSWLKSLLLIITLPVLLFAQAKKAQPASFAFTHVTVIDMTGTPPQPDMTVVMTGDRITTIAPTKKLSLQPNIATTDATGKFLIPGLWDMHVHVLLKNDYAEVLLPLLILNGVTGVRDMGGDPGVSKLWRDAPPAGSMPAPRIIAAGHQLIGRIKNIPLNLYGAADPISDRDEGIKEVKRHHEDHFDFIKVYSYLSRAAYFAISREATELHMPFAGHVPTSVSALDAAIVHQKSIEHLDGILLACSNRERELRDELNEAFEQGFFPFMKVFITQIDQLIATYDQKKASALFENLKLNKTWQVPTLVFHRRRFDECSLNQIWFSQNFNQGVTSHAREKIPR